MATGPVSGWSLPMSTFVGVTPGAEAVFASVDELHAAATSPTRAMSAAALRVRIDWPVMPATVGIDLPAPHRVGVGSSSPIPGGGASSRGRRSRFPSGPWRHGDYRV